jgi:hypothetical protein
MRTIPAPVYLIASLALASLTAACATPAALPGPAAPPAAALPSWDGAMARVFDDTIDREALDHGTVSQSEDAWMGPRTQAADQVVRVRVITTTTQGVGPSQGYRLTLRAIGPQLAGSAPATQDFEISIRPDSPLFAVVRTHDVRMTGKTFVAFFKRFQGRGEADVHWYLTAEAPQILEAVQRASTLSDVGYRQAMPAM